MIESGPCSIDRPKIFLLIHIREKVVTEGECIFFFSKSRSLLLGFDCFLQSGFKVQRN